ncbi:homeobox-leucine zipper protein PROTODERMAL FACTOR 2-like, partial [Trifolium pratense]
LEKFGAQNPINPVDSYNNISSPPNSNQGPQHSVGNYNGAMNGMVGEAYVGGSGIGSDLVKYYVPPQGLDDSKIVELAVVGMDELIRLDQTSGPPLWLPTNSLNGEEYMLQFPTSNIGPNPMKLRHDGSKESAVVFINPISLVDIFMDVVSH